MHSSATDLLRLVACTLIAVSHLVPDVLLTPAAIQFLRSGLFTAIFFTLSGFVICQTSSFWRSTWRASAVNRFARIYPAHCAAFLAMVPAAVIGVDRHPVADVLKECLWWFSGLQVFQFANQRPVSAALNGPAWSVTPLLIGGMLLPVLKWLGCRDWSTRRLAWTTAALVGLRAVVAISSIPWPAGADFDYRHVEPVSRVLEIFIGAFFALSLHRQADSVRNRWIGRDIVLIGSFALLAAGCFLPGSFAGIQLAYLSTHGWGIPFILLFIAAVYWNNGHVESFSKRSWVRMGADMSLYIFLFHAPVEAILSRSIALVPGLRDLNPGHPLAYTLLVAAAVAAVARLAVPVFDNMRNRIVRTLAA